MNSKKKEKQDSGSVRERQAKGEETANRRRGRAPCREISGKEGGGESISCVGKQAPKSLQREQQRVRSLKHGSHPIEVFAVLGIGEEKARGLKELVFYGGSGGRLGWSRERGNGSWSAKARGSKENR